MNQIKLLKLKIQRSNNILDKKRVLYHQCKEVVNQDKLTLPLLCLSAFGSAFILVFFEKIRNRILKGAVNIVKIGLKKIITRRS